MCIITRPPTVWQTSFRSGIKYLSFPNADTVVVLESDAPEIAMLPPNPQATIES